MSTPTKASRELDAEVAEKVMGLDLTAHRDEVSLARAAFSGIGQTWHGRAEVEWAGETFWITMDAGGFDKHGNIGYGLKWWQRREGEPWQAALEAHVAAWRAKPKPYTTDIAAAWEVVEKIREILGARDNAKAGEPDLWAILEQADGEWVAEINWLHHDGTVNEHYSKAATAPLAICLTALQAVEQFTEAAALATLQAVEP